MSVHENGYIFDLHQEHFVSYMGVDTTKEHKSMSHVCNITLNYTSFRTIVLLQQNTIYW